MTFTFHLLHGKDQAGLKEHLLAMLAAIPEGERLLSTSRHDLSDPAGRAAAWLALKTPPLPLGAAPTRWVVLEGIETLKDAAQVNAAEAALVAGQAWAKGKESHLQVIAAAGEEVGASPNVKPFTDRATKGRTHEFVKLPPWETGKQLAAAKGLVEELGLELKPAFVGELVRLTGGDQARIRGELTKLGPLLAAGHKLTIPQLRDLVGQPAVTSRHLVDSLREGRRGRVLEQADLLLAAGETPWTVAGWLLGALHPLLLVAVLAREDDSDVAQLLGWKKGRVWRQKQDLGELTAPGLLALTQGLVAFRQGVTAGRFPGQAAQRDGLLLALAEGVAA